MCRKCSVCSHLCARSSVSLDIVCFEFTQRGDNSLVLIVMRKAAIMFFVLPFIPRNRLQCQRVTPGVDPVG